MRPVPQAAAKYDRLAATYDARWAFYLTQSTSRTLERVAPRGADTLLDVGCGTGQLLRMVVDRWPALRACGMDPSRAMLRMARRGAARTTSLVQAVGECLPIRDESIDWVVSTSVLHYLRDPDAALLEWRRVLRPGGAVIITDWCRDYTTLRGFSLWQRLSSSAETHVHTGAELNSLLTRSSFERGSIDRYRINWFWGLMTATARKPANAWEARKK